MSLVGDMKNKPFYDWFHASSNDKMLVESREYIHLYIYIKLF